MELDKKQKINKNWVWFGRMQKVFFLSFFWFWCFCFFSLCFSALGLYKITQTGYFPAFFWFFVCFVKNPFFLCFCPSTPFFRKNSLWGFLLFFFLIAFSFPNVCLFIGNKFSNIPCLKPKSLSFLAVYFFLLLFLFLFSLCTFQFFCFYVGFVFGIFCCYVCFCLVSCFAFSL